MTADFIRAAVVLTAAVLVAEFLQRKIFQRTVRWPRIAFHPLLQAAAVLLTAGTFRVWPAAVGFLLGTLLLDVLLHPGKDLRHRAVFRWAGYGGLILLFVLLLPPAGWLRRSIWLRWMPFYFSGLALFTGFFLSVFAASSLVGEAVSRYLGQIRSDSGGLQEGQLRERRGLYGGGETIGKLERALIYLFVLVGQPAGVGFLIAAKSILRFGELNVSRDRMEAEYVIIGTFYSFFVGLLIAYLAGYVLGMI
jgi:hypothetical protein